MIIAVRELGRATRLFERAFGLDEHTEWEDADLGARVRHLGESPVFLAEALGGAAELHQRLERFRESPAAILLGTRDMAAAAARLPLVEPSGDWDAARPEMRWIEPARVFGWRIGVLKTDR